MSRWKRALRGAARLMLIGVCLPRPSAGQELTLSELVSAAIRTDPVMAGAAARLTATEEAAVAARAARLPGISVDATLTRFQEPMVVAPLHSFDPLAPPTFDQSLVQGQLALQYTVFDGGQRASRIRGGDALSEAARFGVASAEMGVLERVVTSHLGVLTTRSVLEAADAQLSALESELDRVQRNLAAGTAAEVEVLRAAATLEDARALQSSAAARVGFAERSLARLTGLDASLIAERGVVPLRLAAPEVGPRPGGDPVVASARSRVVAAQERFRDQRAGRLPRVSAAARVLDFGTLGGDHVGEWQAGLQVSWPLFTGGARNAGIRRAEAEVVVAREELAATERTVAQAVDAAETALVEARGRAAALQAAMAQWAEVARIEALALQAGSGVQRDLLRAQAGLFQARAGYAQASRDEILAHVRLAKAVGGLDTTWIDQALGEQR